MKFSRNSSAQGAVEYLVIISIVVVISLIAIALFLSLSDSPSQQIINSSSKTGEIATGGINIVELVIDEQGESLIKVKNNSSDAINLTKISVGTFDNNFSEQLVGMDSKLFSLSGLNSFCPCVSGQASVKCDFKFEYTTSTGLTQVEYRTVTAKCVSDSTPSIGVNVVSTLDTTPPVVNLIFPADNGEFDKSVFGGPFELVTIFAYLVGDGIYPDSFHPPIDFPEHKYTSYPTGFLPFDFNVSDNIGVIRCDLNYNNTIIATDSLAPFGHFSIHYNTLDDYPNIDLNWRVECFDEKGNKGVSEYRKFFVGQFDCGTYLYGDLSNRYQAMNEERFCCSPDLNILNTTYHEGYGMYISNYTCYSGQCGNGICESPEDSISCSSDC